MLFFAISCKKERLKLYSDGGFPLEPKNLEIFNSQYDDYNSDLADGEYDTFGFSFSSNRNSRGLNFDIVSFSVDISYVIEEDRVAIRESWAASGRLGSFQLNMINTEYDELGPYTKQYFDGDDASHLHFYANDQSGNLDIKFIYSNTIRYPDKTQPAEYVLDGPYDVNLVNTENNEAYPVFMADDLYFTSDKNTNFDIYKITIPDTLKLVESLTADYSTPQKVNILCSEKDDKCPYINSNLMVFTSDRDGGFGGFDLWYSLFVDGNWTEPINFGPDINSEFDEYRPIVRHFDTIKNDLMIFSSNRTGGKGGFDLYYVGIDKFIENK